MIDEQASPPQLPSSRKDVSGKEKSSRRGTGEDTEDKENGRIANTLGKKGTSPQNRLKTLKQSNGLADSAHLKEKDSLQVQLSTEDMLFETKLSSDLSDDGMSQGAPLSIKNIFKAVKTFSKRLPKSQKLPRLDPTKDRKETDVVVFERPTTPRVPFKPGRGSRSLPPILDFQEILCSEITFDEQDGSKVKSPSDRRMRARTADNTLADMNPDALQEFGSIDTSIPMRGGEWRTSRKSFACLYKQGDEQGPLHF